MNTSQLFRENLVNLNNVIKQAMSPTQHLPSPSFAECGRFIIKCYHY